MIFQAINRNVFLFFLLAFLLWFRNQSYLTFIYLNCESDHIFMVLGRWWFSFSFFTRMVFKSFSMLKILWHFDLLIRHLECVWVLFGISVNFIAFHISRKINYTFLCRLFLQNILNVNALTHLTVNSNALHTTFNGCKS